MAVQNSLLVPYKMGPRTSIAGVPGSHGFFRQWLRTQEAPVASTLPVLGTKVEEYALNRLDFTDNVHELLLLMKQLSKKRLFEFIEDSKSNPRIARAAANAISALNAAGVSFSGRDFSGISVTGARLPNAIFYRTNLQGAHFENTFLPGVCLDGVIARGIHLMGAKFVEKNSLQGHLNPIDFMELSRDGSILLSHSQGNICVWDVEHSQKLISLPPLAKASILSPDGAKIAIYGNGRLSFWDVKTNECLFSCSYSSGLPPLFTEEGDVCFIGEMVGTRKGWQFSIQQIDLVTKAISRTWSLNTVLNGENSKPIFWFYVPKNQSYEFWLIGRFLAEIHRVFIHRKTGYGLDTFSGLGATSQISLSSDKSRVVFLRATEFSIISCSLIKKIADIKSVNQLQAAFSADGKFLLTKDPNQTATLWELTHYTRVMTFSRVVSKLHPSLFLRKNELLLAHNDGVLVIWDTEKQKKVENLFASGEEIQDLFVIGNRSLLFSHGTKIVQKTLAPLGLTSSFVTTPLTVFYSSQNLFFMGNQDGDLQIWDQEKGKIICNLKGHKKAVRFLGTSGTQLFSHGEEGKFCIWDLITKECMTSFPLPGKLSLAFFAFENKTKLFVVMSTGRLEIWNIASQSKEKEVSLINTIIIHCATFQEGRKLALVGIDGVLSIFSLETLSFLNQKKIGRVTAFHLSGANLWLGGEEKVERWDLETFQMVDIFHLKDICVRQIAHYHDLLAIGNNQGEVILLTEEKKSQFRVSSKAVSYLSFDTKGQLISIGKDQQIRSWKVENQELFLQWQTFFSLQAAQADLSEAHDFSSHTSLFQEKMAYLTSEEEFIRRIKECNTKELGQPQDEEGNTFVHLAARFHYPKALQVLAEKGGSFDVQNSVGDTPLHLAIVSYGPYQTETVLHLLEHSQCDLANQVDRTPAYVACDKGNLGVLRLLSEKLGGIFSTRSNGWTLAQEAVASGEIECLYFLVINGVNLSQPDRYGGTPANVAALEGQIDCLKLLAESEADLTLPDQYGSTPAHSAARKGHLECLKLLGEYKVDFSKPDMYGYYPLHLAVKGGHLEIVRLLSYSTDLNLPDKHGNTAAHLAAKQGDIECLKLLAEHKVNFSCSNEDGTTPAHLAVKFGYLNCFRFLVEHGIALDISDIQGVTLAHLAAGRGDIEVLELLADHKINLSLPAKDGWTPAHVAVIGGELESLKVLAKHGVNLAVASQTGRTLAHAAARYGYVKILRFLASYGIDLSQADHQEITPLHVLLEEGGDLECLQLLIEHKLDLSKPGKNGNTPVHLAVRFSRIDCLRLLIEHKADLSQVDKDGQTPAYLAAYTGDIDCLKLLASHQAELGKPDKNGISPAHVAAREGHIDCLQIIAERGINLSNPTMNGATPAHLAAHAGNVECLELLAKYKVDLSVSAPNGFTPVHLAAQEGKLDCLKLLMEHTTDSAWSTRLGVTPAHLAAERGHLDCLKLLADYAFDFSQLDLTGKTSAHVAAGNGHENCLEFLVAKGANLAQPDQSGKTPSDYLAEYKERSSIQSAFMEFQRQQALYIRMQMMHN